MPKLSILICSVNNRVDNFLQTIYKEINMQLNKEVEVLTIVDNKSMSIGEKRNWLISMAKGEYVVFVDDDDMITQDYVQELLDGIKTGKDVICFNAKISINGGDYKLVRYSRNLNNVNLSDGTYERMPNHLMCWKADIAKKVKYEDISFGEDTKWAEQMISNIQTEHYIDKVLYYYDFNEKTSESIKYKN